MDFPVVLNTPNRETNPDPAVERSSLERENGRHAADQVGELPTRKARRAVFAQAQLSHRDRSKANGVDDAVIDAVDRDRKGPFASIVDVARR